MAEENQVQQEPAGPTVPAEPQQVTTKEPQRVTMKDPKKVDAGKRLAAINHKKKKREEQAQLEKTTSGVNQYYGIRAVIALGVIGGLGYYIYQTKKGEVPNRALQAPTARNPPQQPRSQMIAAQLQTLWSGTPVGPNKFEMG